MVLCDEKLNWQYFYRVLQEAIQPHVPVQRFAEMDEALLF